MHFRIELLPLPLGPASPTKVPCCTSNETSSKARTCLSWRICCVKRLLKFTTLSCGVSIFYTLHCLDIQRCSIRYHTGQHTHASECKKAYKENLVVDRTNQQLRVSMLWIFHNLISQATLNHASVFHDQCSFAEQANDA